MPETFEEKSLNERIEYSNSSFYLLSILFRSRGKRESKHANAAASVKWQIASLLPLEIGECVSAANPSPIGSFFSMEKGRQARGEERKKGNLCVVTKRLHGFATTRDANDLLALCASFLLLLFLPSFLPPSILLLRTHAHVTLPRYSRNQFLKPPNRSRDLRGDRRDPRSRSIRCARIPANRSPLQSDHLPYHLKYSKKRVKKQTCTKCRYRIADSKLILCLF